MPTTDWIFFSNVHILIFDLLFHLNNQKLFFSTSTTLLLRLSTRCIFRAKTPKICGNISQHFFNSELTNVCSSRNNKAVAAASANRYKVKRELIIFHSSLTNGERFQIYDITTSGLEKEIVHFTFLFVFLYTFALFPFVARLFVW